MSNRFNDDFKDRVLEATNIGEVISDYVTMKRVSGGDLLGLCPFHKEKTPSFRVHSDQGFYKCFGCGRGGNVFTFLMEIEGLSFPESLKTLAERAGIEPPQQAFSPDAQRARTERDKIFSAMQHAMKWFHSRLPPPTPTQNTGGEKVSTTSTSPESKKALQYLLDRNIDLETIRRYQIGWAESGWDTLVKHAGRTGIDGQTLYQSSLAYRRKDGSGFVDMFRARIMFPILNLSGKPVAFGARRVEGITPESDEAKYINSNETAVYRKGEHLYGLYTSREFIRREKFAYLVEGYTDLLALIHAGLWNVVASLGTALTQFQAQLIGRFARRVHVVYDSDEAGVNAAVRAVDILTLAGLEARLVELPEGNDPDTLLQNEGKDRLRKVLGKDVTFVEFRLNTAGFNKSLSQSERIETTRGLLETIQAITDPLRRDLLIQELSNKTGISHEALDQARVKIKSRLKDQESAKERISLSILPETVAERDLIHALLGHPNLANEYLDSLTPNQFTQPQLREIFHHIEKSYLQSEELDVSSLPEQFNDPSVRAFIADAVFAGEKTSHERASEEILKSLKKIQKRDLLKKKKEIEIQIIEESRYKQTRRDYLRKLQAENVELNKKIHALGI